MKKIQFDPGSPGDILINISMRGGVISARHSRAGDYVTIVKTTDNPIFVIPGLTRNPVSFQAVARLDAGSGLSST